MNQTIIDIISDPFDGPYYGEDYCFDDSGYIQISNAKLAALILRKINQSNQFDKKLVRIGKAGDVVLLGFDTLEQIQPVHNAMVGPDEVPVEVKEDQGTFYIYVNGRRSIRTFVKMSAVKKYIKKLDQELTQAELEEPVAED